MFRERAATRQKVREAMAAGAVWAGLAAGFVLLLGLILLLRQDVARIWPRTAGAYAMAGLPVNLVGLTIENQHAQPQLQDGHAALVISGSLRNIRDRPVVAPPLRVSLMYTAGRSLAVKIADPGGARIPPGEARHFTVNMLDPPVSATDVDIAFVMDRQPRKAIAPAGAPPAARLSLRGGDGARPAAGRWGRSCQAARPATPSRCPVPRPMRCPRPPPTRPPIPVAEPGAPAWTPLLSAEDIAARVEALADRIAPVIDDETVAVCLLTGGLWFAADLMRALARRGRHPLFDALWLSSYEDERSSLGRVEVRAGLQRSVQGRIVLLMDDVADSGLSLAEAARIASEAGATTVLSAAFARKPWPTPRAVEPDFVGWEAPDRFLVGYGLDDAGRLRGLPGIAALD